MKTILATIALALAVPASAADFTIDLWAGVKRYDALGLRSGLQRDAANARADLLDGDFNAVGATGILKVGLLELGALYEGALDFDTTKNAVVAPLIGVGFDASIVRLELLGEVGGANYYDVAGSKQSTWLPYAGVRPGVSLRLSAVGPLRFVVGAWGFARWDITTRDITVAGPEGAAGSTYRVGGSTYGVVGRVGLEI